MKVYSGVDALPKGRASDEITEGCMVLEGGAWRGIYSQGALDAIMEAGINLQTTAGISAGAMSGIGYVSGQIGFCGRMNLTYRHDQGYCGIGAFVRDHGITGFSHLFGEIFWEVDPPFDSTRFADPARGFVCAATNCMTGRAEYFEKGKCSDIFRAVQASATVPFISKPVMIDGTPYLDGGCSVKIPYRWAKARDFKNIVVIRTRDRSYRKEEKSDDRMNNFFYKKYPAMIRSMHGANRRYNELLDLIDEDEKSGRIFVLAPKDPVTISRFEGDMEKLGDLYWRGYNETKERIPELKTYISRS